MKVESNWTKTRYSFICEDEKDKEFLDKMNKYIDKLEEENRKPREEKKADTKLNIIIAIIVIMLDACLIYLGWNFGYDYAKKSELHISKQECIQLFNSLK